MSELNELDSELDPEKEISEITFNFSGAHMAICHKSQGFSANNKPMPLLIKADEPFPIDEDALFKVEQIKLEKADVRIETDMVTFLRKWMGMFFDDASALAQLLGFEDETETVMDEFVEEIMEGITILRSASEGHIPRTAMHKDITKLQAFIDSNEKLTDSFSEGNPGMKTEPTQVSKPSEKTKTNQKDELMATAKTDQEKLEKANSDLEARLAKLEKQATDAEAENKVLNSKVEDFEKAQHVRLEKAFEAKVQTYSFITEEEREAFAKTLLEVDSEAVIVALDKAQAAIVALGESQGSQSGELNLKLGGKSDGVKNIILKQFPQADSRT